MLSKTVLPIVIVLDVMHDKCSNEIELRPFDMCRHGGANAAGTRCSTGPVAMPRGL